MSEYRELSIVNSELKAIVDAEDFLRLNQYRWRMQRSPGGKRRYLYRQYTAAGRCHRVSLAREITGAPDTIPVRFVGDNDLNYRRANLRAASGFVYRLKHLRAKPFAVQIDIDGRKFFCGSWPTEEKAEQVRIVAEQVAPILRGRALSKKVIQRVLNLATGRESRKKTSAPNGDELINSPRALCRSGFNRKSEKMRYRRYVLICWPGTSKQES
jgi:hypothetical protein